MAVRHAYREDRFGAIAAQLERIHAPWSWFDIADRILSDLTGFVLRNAYQLAREGYDETMAKVVYEEFMYLFVTRPEMRHEPLDIPTNK